MPDAVSHHPRSAQALLGPMEKASRPWEIGPEDFFRDVDRIRALFAKLVQAADPGRVAIIPATSYGLAQLARNTPLDPERNVVM